MRRVVSFGSRVGGTYFGRVCRPRRMSAKLDANGTPYTIRGLSCLMSSSDGSPTMSSPTRNFRIRGLIPSPKMLFTRRSFAFAVTNSSISALVAREKWVIPNPSVRPSSRYRSTSPALPPTSSPGVEIRLYMLDPAPYRLVVPRYTSAGGRSTARPARDEAITLGFAP